MKRTIKTILSLIFVLIMLLSTVVCASAVQIPADSDAVVLADADGADVMPLADEIVWKYTTMNGILYKRRWNNTTGSWYDRAWVPA